MLIPVTNGESASDDLERKCEEPLKTVAGSVSTQDIEAAALDKHLKVQTHFHPMANPQEGSKNLVEKAENEPAMGKMTLNSAKDCIVQYCSIPMTM